ncbi:MAG: multiheme c-type cytochrome [Desulfuromonadales bacterium]|nr:multiheme c-type cytochrome [Desulfuromonadales bacterium]
MNVAGILLALLLVPAVLFADECIDCHQQETPGAVIQWQQSGHAPANVGCRSCHGDDHEKILQGNARVVAAVCARCHRQAFAEHSASKHGMGLHTGWGCTRNLPGRDQHECRFCHEEGSTLPVSAVMCARFLRQSSEMGQLGCNRCHMVENACGSCHGNHLTDLDIVRDPAVCAKCHMGPDHPQWEMWQTSQHGTLNRVQGRSIGPDCQLCHMPGGSHNVSHGITATPAGQVYPEERYKAERVKMINLCRECHAGSFAEEELAAADAVRSQSKQLVAEAAEIISELHDLGLLDPMPQDRPAHPLRRHELVLDGQMLYEDISHIERLFFTMKKFALAKTYKGAYHQNPAYTHWLGNAELKMLLVDIRSEASRLRERGGERGADERTLEERLTVLQGKFRRGLISQQEYTELKAEMLRKLTR